MTETTTPLVAMGTNQGAQTLDGKGKFVYGTKGIASMAL